MDDPGRTDDRPDRPDDRPDVDDEAQRRSSLPPGSGTRGEPDEIDGNVRFERPFEDAPGEGRLAPDWHNPPPPAGPGPG